MAENVNMPQLGESVTEGTVSKWLVTVGDTVKKYDPICEVTTDKVNADVPSSFSGTITEIIAEEGETIPVGALMCKIAIEAEESPMPSTVESSPVSLHTGGTAEMKQEHGAKQRYSPSVLKMAQEHNLDLTKITGTGMDGRITRRDLLKIVDGKRTGKVADTFNMKVETQAASLPRVNEENLAVPKQKVSTPDSSAVSVRLNHGDQVIPLTAVRKTIANRMVQSKHETPHAWLMMECDVTGLVHYRSKVKDDFKEKEGFTLTYLPFFIKSAVETLKEFPKLNSQWADDKIIVRKGIHLSVAVATEEALYVPVIKDADQKSIFGLAKAVDELAKKTREGKLTPHDMTGGTFTVNNTGSFGSVLSAPIINHPQAAILTMEAIVKRPVVIDNMIAIRDTMNICLSFDHRVLDGLVCGKFLKSLKKKIESYGYNTTLY
ncbi:branched-chain alpha-keto acid dehydrogenase subunit E2 [Mesobacillus campisalis]|uniref:Dihydrolipoamide acetyltransferase component of pyruvate dehydrogenase complex n=1 Tax=Mesobacillus campisalis TaxID=1408103 RepID=A0A0M2SX88_9BACI|nr:dihydrolipoamide acetyltransferase family protein [Mesobacillus campisalis]KKK39189.1 branched-chain alpha-keto acid dehydrogenase subunit E2 [Mesobacillus campisalis]